jgi:hypothetical protein
VKKDLGFELAYQRGVQAAIWGMPAVSLASLRDATMRDLGAGHGDVVYMSGLPLPRHELLTASDEWPFVIVMLDLRRGPMVVEVPQASASGFSLSGSAVDAWMVPIVDIGMAGEDRGAGGRYLFVPPDASGYVPDGFFAVPSKTFDVYVSLRPVGDPPASLEERREYLQKIRVYEASPTSELPPHRYIDAHPRAWRTLPSYDITFFERLARTVEREPTQEKDAVMIGMLATLGIRKGVPFLPERRLARALEQAVTDARQQMEHYFETPGLGTAPYRPDGHWVTGNRTPHDGATFLVDGKLLIDERAGGYSYWTRFAPKRPRPGGVFCLRALRDASGELFDGRSVYRLSIPRRVPVNDRWSLIAYAKESKTFLPNELDRIGLSSRDTSHLRTGADGSLEIWFGPAAPAAWNVNWIPTGRDFFLVFWLYGPEAPVLGRSFRMPDLEKVA